MSCRSSGWILAGSPVPFGVMTWASGKKKGKIKLPKILGPHSSYRGLFIDSLKLKCPFQEEPHVQVYRGAKSPPVLFPAKLISPPERIAHKI